MRRHELLFLFNGDEPVCSCGWHGRSAPSSMQAASRWSEHAAGRWQPTTISGYRMKARQAPLLTQ